MCATARRRGLMSKREVSPPLPAQIAWDNVQKSHSYLFKEERELKKYYCKEANECDKVCPARGYTSMADRKFTPVCMITGKKIVWLKGERDTTDEEKQKFLEMALPSIEKIGEGLKRLGRDQFNKLDKYYPELEATHVVVSPEFKELIDLYQTFLEFKYGKKPWPGEKADYWLFAGRHIATSHFIPFGKLIVGTDR
jgi:hypothetical protein